MKVKVSFSKDSDLTVAITVVDCEGYHTIYVFDGKSYVQKSFPLTYEGLAKAQRWVGETIACLRAKVEEWRGFKLPPDEVIEI